MPTRLLTGEGRADGEETDKHPSGSPGYWAVRSFGINAENHINIYDGAATRPHEIIFSTDAQLALVAEELPTSQLVEIWNALPGVTPVRKFKSCDRHQPHLESGKRIGMRQPSGRAGRRSTRYS